MFKRCKTENESSWHELKAPPQPSRNDDDVSVAEFHDKTPRNPAAVAKDGGRADQCEISAHPCGDPPTADNISVSEDALRYNTTNPVRSLPFARESALDRTVVCPLGHDDK